MDTRSFLSVAMDSDMALETEKTNTVTNDVDNFFSGFTDIETENTKLSMSSDSRQPTSSDDSDKQSSDHASDYASDYTTEEEPPKKTSKPGNLFEVADKRPKPDLPDTEFVMTSKKTTKDWLTAMMSSGKIKYVTTDDAATDVLRSMLTQLGHQLLNASTRISCSDVPTDVVSDISDDLRDKFSECMKILTSVSNSSAYAIANKQVTCIGGDDCPYAAEVPLVTDYVIYGDNRDAQKGDDFDALQELQTMKKPFKTIPIEGDKTRLRMYVGLTPGRNIAKLVADTVVHERKRYSEICITYTDITKEAMELIRYGISMAMPPLPKAVSRKVVILGVRYPIVK